MKIFFITPYSKEGASNRYRIEQYLPYLKKDGIEYCIRPFVSSEFYRIIYKKGRFFEKVYFFLKALIGRISDIFLARRYDIVFIHREACPLGPPIFEWLIYKLKKPIILDFDDAIFLENFNPVNKFYNFLKFPSKTKRIIRMSSQVIVANRFLEEYARNFNPNVHIVPTSIDTDKFNVAINRRPEALTIGWIGSFTTAPYLKIIFPVMQRLSQRYNFILKIVGAGREVFIEDVKIENIAWKLEREVEDFQSIDIGIYPLEDSLWAAGKAGFKAIQYMAVGTPVVASPVGMTKELIRDGINGFLAESEEEWVAKISRLIEDTELCQRIGLNGRKTVEEKYSTAVNARRYIEIIKLCSRIKI
jgi:glycosyltransferase involved in cell wall biosynthesis